MCVTQFCPTLCNPMDCSSAGSSRILQARILEWVPILFSRGPSQPRNKTQVSHMAGRFSAVWATRANIESCGNTQEGPLTSPQWWVNLEKVKLSRKVLECVTCKLIPENYAHNRQSHKGSESWMDKMWVWSRRNFMNSDLEARNSTVVFRNWKKSYVARQWRDRRRLAGSEAESLMACEGVWILS